MLVGVEFLISFGRALNIRGDLCKKLLKANVDAYELVELIDGLRSIFPLLAEYLYDIPGLGTMLFIILNI